MQIQFDSRGRGLLERIACAALLLAVLVLGFFFLVAALIAGAVVAGAILLRLWWLKRKLAQAARDEFITTEYRVIDNEQLEAPPPDRDGTPPGQEPGR
jgi:hypothetical protein